MFSRVSRDMKKCIVFIKIAKNKSVRVRSVLQCIDPIIAFSGCDGVYTIVFVEESASTKRFQFDNDSIHIIVVRDTVTRKTFLCMQQMHQKEFILESLFNDIFDFFFQ